MKPIRGANADGFTFLEAILVLLFMSIFATVAVLRPPPPDVTLKARSDVLASHIRYAQSRAMNTDTIWGIMFGEDGNTYWLFSGPSDNRTQRSLPGETAFLVDLDTHGVTLNPVNFPLGFDTWGRPLQDDVPLSDNFIISMVKGGNSKQMTITANTGFVQSP